MILLDSNIVVYLKGNSFNEKDLNKLTNSTLDTCNVIVAEVLGYTFNNPKDEVYLRDLLKSMKNHAFNKEVTDKVIELRKTTNLKLPDAIIAATALVNNLELWTHNISDFKKVQGLKIHDPVTD